jgi:hypothetical protein
MKTDCEKSRGKILDDLGLPNSKMEHDKAKLVKRILALLVN